VILVAALGDSITAGSPGWDPVQGAGDPESQYEFWAARKDTRLTFRNCGIYGQRTDEIAERLENCAEDAGVLVVQGGINDIAQRRPVEPAAENLAAIVTRGKELGLRVALVDVLPWNNGFPWAAEPIRDLNRLIGELAAAEEVPVLPFYETLEDPGRPDRMRVEWTSDGDHPSVAGYRRLGEEAFRLP
jgi:lysophospholipase L1-like esterase